MKRDDRPRRARTVTIVACALVAGAIVVVRGGSSSDTSRPRLVTPITLGGSSGVGPRVVDSAEGSSAAHPGARTTELRDRVLTVVASSRRPSTEAGFTLITVDVIVQNRTGSAIPNDATSFQLTGSSGDVFAARNGSDPFFAALAGGTTGRGSIDFEVPTASDSQLRLLYRTEDGSDAVVVPLTPS